MAAPIDNLMKLASLFTDEQIMLDLQGEVCDEALAGIVEHLISKRLLKADLREEVLTALHEREEKVSTGIGSGVAIPHAFSESIDQVVAAFARSKEGVDFEAIDNAPVHFVLLFIVPKKEHNLHLQTLAAVAKMFKDCEVRKQLQEAVSKEEVLDILASRPSRAGAEK